MSPDPPTVYEQLAPEEAAHIDAVCDRFERAWKETRAGGTVPRLASYLDHGHGAARAVLLRELTALDQACRERYGPAAGPENARGLGAEAEDPALSATRLQRRRTDIPAGPSADWPSIPGLELLDVLGSGGMGVVFRARQATLDRDVAVKFLRDGHRADPELRERFLQEARAVARLRHPHLVQLYAFGEVAAAGGATSQPYLVLEYVSGGSLADLVRGSPQPPAEAARLVETLAEAIHYAHQQGVIHRDLKPANVLLGARGEGKAENPLSSRAPRPAPLAPHPKITDFGLAKFLAGGDLTLSGYALGTPSYMAPEQAAGNSGLVTTAVDVYGLGTILYEALTGRPPFAAATADATLAQVRQDEPVPPRRLQPTVPRDLETICLKCLRKEAGRRYATAQELADDLRRFRGGEPIRARPVGAWERAVRWGRRQPALAGALAALAVVFLAGLSGILWQWQSARHHAAAADRNAAAFRRERDTALRERDRAALHLREARKRVDRLTQVGRELLQRPRLYQLGKEVMEDALSYYEVILPQEGSDPELRLEAARLYHRVGRIHHDLGRFAKAVEAYGQETHLLADLGKAEPADQVLRHELALSHRWRGNALRDMDRAGEARAAYGRAAELHDQLLRDAPGDAGYQMTLANTLLNLAVVLSRRDDAEELEGLHRRALQLNQDAVAAAPDKAEFQAELALALESQGMFLLDTEQVAAAEGALRKALAIRQQLFVSGCLGRSEDRYLARVYANLGRVLAAADQTAEAERSYRAAAELLEALVKEFPDRPFARKNLAEALGDLADLLKSPGRQGEVEELRRRVIRHYEILTADFREDPSNRRNLVQSHALFGLLLCETGRCAAGAEQYRQALKVDPASAAAHNHLAWFLATAAEPGLRDAAEAVRLARKAVAAEPKSGSYRKTLGVAHYRNGDDKGAVAELEESMRLRGGGDSYDWFFLAMAHWRLGDRGKARTWFDRAIQGMDRHQLQNSELRRFRAEAETLLADAGKR
jgi:tetratricopeptide (TPR) repeat protein